MNHPLVHKLIGSHHGYESAAELDDQIRAALDLNLSHACIQYKTARSDLLVKLSPDAQIESAIGNSESVDDEIPSPDTCQSRRQALLDQYLKAPNDAVSTIWSETTKDFDEGLAVVETLDLFQVSFQGLLLAFFKNQITSLALTKYRFLSRWNCLILDSESVNKYGSLMRDRLASITLKFHEYNERILRSERSQTFMIPDALDYIRHIAESERLLDHTECFYIKLKWICREQQSEIESDIDAVLNNPEFHESNSSMFLHREDKSIDKDLKLILSQLKLPFSLDLSNAHRLVGEIRSHIETVLRQIADQTCRADYDDNELSDTRPILRKATWTNDLKKCFVVVPSYSDVVQSRLLRADASVDKVLLFESLSIEQQLDLSTLQTRADDHAKFAIDLLNKDHSRASAQDSNVIKDIPAVQKFQALFMARTALASKCEQKIVRRLNILRSVQRRLVIDALGGLAMEDPLQLHRHKNGSEIPDSGGTERYHPSDFVFNLDDFMKFEGIQHRDDSFESMDDDDDEFRVKDFDDVEITYDAAIDDWKTLKKELLMMATFFIRKIDAAEADEQCGVGTDSNTVCSESSVMCDRLSILVDLYRCELEFQSAKCRLVFALLEAYEHTIDKGALNSIAQRIIHVINVRPRIDLNEVYFKSHYLLDTRILLLEAEIINDVTHFQIDLQTVDMNVNENHRPLFPYGRPVGLFGICTSAATIKNCLRLMGECVTKYDDIWSRSHPHALLNPSYSPQAIQMAVLSAIRDLWKHQSSTFRRPMFPLSPFMESLRFDPIYKDVDRRSKRLETLTQRATQEGYS